MSSRFLLFNESPKDDSDLGRARSMTKTLEQQANGVIVPSSAINIEFAQVVQRLRALQEQWTKHRMTRKVPMITLKYTDSNDMKHNNAHHKIQSLESEKKQLATTVSSLFKEMQHLKQQNQNMALCVENLRKVLHESKSYILSLKQRNDNLASDMDFQSDLHEKQRRVWKTKIRDTSPDVHPPSHPNQQMYSHSLQASDNVLQLSNVNDLDAILREYETVIEKQREQIKYKNQQLEQQRNVHQHHKNHQYAELNQEMNHIKNQKQQEIEELKMRLEQSNATIERAKAENARLHKTLQVTNSELNANKKLMAASRPSNVTQTEQQLFQLEQDYLNLSEVLITCQGHVTKIENELDAKQHELDDANRLIDEQNKTMEEYKKNIALLQANLAESKSDQSDLIEALQKEWEQSKEEVMRYKQKCRQLQHEKDELMAQNMNFQFENERKMNENNDNNHNNMNDRNNNNANAELVVLVDDLRRKLEQKDAEVKSQEMLMAQLMEQQRAFQKRNKTLVTRLKAMKSQRGAQHFRIDEGGGGAFDNYGMQNGYQKHGNVQMPDNVYIELKSVYEHYLRNPIISSNTNDMIQKIRAVSHKLVDRHGNNDYVLPDFGGQLRINSPSTIMYVVEHILIQRQRAIISETEAHEEIFSLKTEHEQNVNKIQIEKKKLNGNIRTLTNQLAKYVEQIHDMEEQKLLYESQQHEMMLSENGRVKKENERIAQEFLQGANLWNAEKAIMSAERAQLENDISYVSHNLEQLIIERAQFEHEADQFQALYGNLISVLREKGMRVEVEYNDDAIDDKDNNNNNASHLTAADIRAVAAKDSDRLSQRRKRNTMRLKLYQATTSPAISTPDDDDDDDNDDEDEESVININANSNTTNELPPKATINIHIDNFSNVSNVSNVSTLSQISTESLSQNSPPHNNNTPASAPVTAPCSPKENKRNHSNNELHVNKKHANPKMARAKSHHTSSLKSFGSKKSADGKRHSAGTPQKSPSKDDAQQHKKSSLWKRVSSKKRRNKEKNKEKEKERSAAAEKEREKESEKEKQVRESLVVAAIEDEADAYIPFDEPDEFNLLDQEYKKIAMKFVEAENDNFDITDSNIINGDDVNLLAQEVLSQELQRKQQSLPVLQGWIEKKSPTFARGWQKRWVIVREYNIFYGKNKTDIKDTKNEKERKKFLNAIPLLVVQYIVGTDHSRSGRKFEIVARDPRTGDRRHYQWKAASREECDKWVHGLNAHKKLLAARLQFLANTAQHQQQQQQI